MKSVSILDSLFQDNHSRYLSNCLTFSGFSLILFNSTFINNTAIFSESMIQYFLSNIAGVPDIAQLNPEIGGILYFQGVNLTINVSCFIGGTGCKGGALYITSYSTEIIQNVIITESYFKGNRGNVGGAINFCIDLKIINATIDSCIFVSNIGKSYIIN